MTKLTRHDLVGYTLCVAVAFFCLFAMDRCTAPARADTIQHRDPVVVVLKDILRELRDIKREMRRHR